MILTFNPKALTSFYLNLDGVFVYNFLQYFELMFSREVKDVLILEALVLTSAADLLALQQQGYFGVQLARGGYRYFRNLLIKAKKQLLIIFM